MKKKRQHFVPKLYLKRFSFQSEGKQINIYVISTRTFIEKGSLAKQAYEDYFYGKDEILENALELIETSVSDLINNIVSDNKLPKYFSTDHLNLLVFVISLHARTRYAADEINEFTDKAILKVFSNNVHIKDYLKKVNISMNNPAAFAMSTAASSVPLGMDLKFKLLINKTKYPFITSDNPVVFYNKFFESRKTIGSSTGVAVKGLKIFLPLSTSHYLIFYDGGIYKIGNKKEMLINVTLEKDVNELNKLQFVAANECLFFNERMNKSYLNKVETTTKKYRRVAKVQVEKYKSVDLDDQGALIHTYKEDIKCNLELSFMKIRKVARKYDIESKLIYFRNEELCQIHREFMNELSKGKYKFSEFGRYYLSRTKTLKK